MSVLPRAVVLRGEEVVRVSVVAILFLALEWTQYCVLRYAG